MRKIIISSLIIFWMSVVAILGSGLEAQKNNNVVNSNPSGNYAADDIGNSGLTDPLADNNESDNYDPASFGSAAANNNAITSSTNNSGSSTLSAQKVAAHNNEKDCWMVIEGKVYDFTKYLPYHPGGSVTIIPYCGKDATAAFNTKDKNPSVPHSQSATDMMTQYFVGNLGQNTGVARSSRPSSVKSSAAKTTTPTK